eukprot:jgi/Botrbrau1/22455/Bobra.0091s0057.1
MGCCGSKTNSAGDGEEYASMRTGAPSAADIEARTKAAEAAAARQAKFDQSPGGKAARKAVENAAKEKAAAGVRQDAARDWLS